MLVAIVAGCWLYEQARMILDTHDAQLERLIRDVRAVRHASMLAINVVTNGAHYLHRPGGSMGGGQQSWKQREQKFSHETGPWGQKSRQHSGTDFGSATSTPQKCRLD